MPTFRLYDFNVHCKDTEFTIREVDPDRYCWFDLIADLRDVEGIHAPSNVGVNVKVSYQSRNGRIQVQTDDDLLLMFELIGSPLVNLYVEVGGETEIGHSQVSQVLDNEPNEEQIGKPDIIGNQGQYEDVEGFDGGEEDLFTIGDEDGFNIQWSSSDSEDPAYKENEEEIDDDSESSYDFEDFTKEESGSGGEDPHMDKYQSNDSSGCDESDVEAKRKKAKQGTIFQDNSKEKIAFEKGMRFRDVNHFRDVLRDYAIQEGFILVRDKNEKKRVTAHCAGVKCHWRVHASPMPDGITYQVKSLHPKHDCTLISKNAEANSTWIAKKLSKRLRENPDLKIEAIKSELSRKYGIDASWMQIYRARRKALEEIEGSHEGSYVKLPRYAAKIRKSNPGSVVKIQVDRLPGQVNPSFKRFFMCLEAHKSGFLKGCRPFIGLDGCHLKGPFGGVLLATVGLDANEGLYPLAYAIVESETKDSWMFFLDNRRTSLDAAAETK